jgi:hypothetical protein
MISDADMLVTFMSCLTFSISSSLILADIIVFLVISFFFMAFLLFEEIIICPWIQGNYDTKCLVNGAGAPHQQRSRNAKCSEYRGIRRFYSIYQILEMRLPGGPRVITGLFRNGTDVSRRNRVTVLVWSVAEAGRLVGNLNLRHNSLLLHDLIFKYL